MKPKALFWGLFFISIGLLFLLKNTASVAFDFDFAKKFWPIVLILLGLGYIVKVPIWKEVLSGFAGLASGLLLFALISQPFACSKKHFRTTDEPVVNKYSEPYSDSIKSVKLRFSGGAGSFSFFGNASELIKVDATQSKPEYYFTSERMDDIQEIDIKMRDSHIEFEDSIIVGKVNVYLNNKPSYDFFIETGAASVNLDLSTLTLGDLAVQVGAASLVVRLGKPLDGESDVSIETGASSIELTIPSDVEAELVTDLALSSKEINGLKGIGENIYRTAGFEGSSKNFKIHVNGGVSSLKVSRGN